MFVSPLPLYVQAKQTATHNQNQQHNNHKEKNWGRISLSSLAIVKSFIEYQNINTTNYSSSQKIGRLVKYPNMLDSRLLLLHAVSVLMLQSTVLAFMNRDIYRLHKDDNANERVTARHQSIVSSNSFTQSDIRRLYNELYLYGDYETLLATMSMSMHLPTYAPVGVPSPFGSNPDFPTTTSTTKSPTTSPSKKTFDSSPVTSYESIAPTMEPIVNSPSMPTSPIAGSEIPSLVKGSKQPTERPTSKSMDPTKLPKTSSGKPTTSPSQFHVNIPSTMPNSKSQEPTTKPSKSGIKSSRTKQPTTLPTLKMDGKRPSSAPKTGSMQPINTRPTNQSPAAPVPSPVNIKEPSNGDSNQPTTSDTPMVPNSQSPSQALRTPSTTPPPTNNSNNSNNSNGPVSDLPTQVGGLFSDVPSFNPTPTFYTNELVFQCTELGVDIVLTPYPEDILTTVIAISVTYSVETLALLNTYQSDLERSILATSLAGALQCEDGGAIFASLPSDNTGDTDLTSIPITTQDTGEQCTTEVLGSFCRVLKTELQVIINEDVDSGVAAFLAYVKLQEDMANGSMIKDIPSIDKIIYIRPLPLLPPIVEGDNDDNNDNPDNVSSENQARISASPWTLGAVVAMCTGGFVALWAWIRNRRTRNRRHMQLIEGM